MKRLIWIAMSFLIAPMGAWAQGPTTNPVSTTMRQLLDRYGKNLVATAQEMPADKYGYHPTPEQMTFGKTIGHVAEVNSFACSKVSDMPAPEGPKLSDSDSKDKLITALKASIDFCTQAFSKLNDSMLGDPVTLRNGRPSTRFGAVLEVTDDLIDHYAALAVYLRLNGLLPPTAQPKP